MHREHDHFDPTFVHGGAGKGGANRGDNSRATAQWQTPHDPHHPHDHAPPEGEPDLDLVEAAFRDAFPNAPDVTSFLRLTGIPFEGRLGDGTGVRLLRVVQETRVDVASLAPHLGGGSFRYDPLPAAMVSKRAELGFVYFDGTGTRTLTFDEARGLKPGAGSEGP